MRRVVVLGARGFFGGAVAELLRAGGAAPLRAARTGGDMRCDAEDRESLRAALRSGDVVVDAAGPFQERTTALVEAALEIGFDVIDLCDALGHVRRVRGLEERIRTRGIRVLSACSTVSTVSALAVRRSGARAPVRLTGFLAPATRHSARRGTAASLVGSLGKPVEVRRNGTPAPATGWGEERAWDMPPPVGPVNGGLFESADVDTLPRVWPTLRDVALYADSRVFGMNAVLRLAARWPSIFRPFLRPNRLALSLARLCGAGAGGIGYEVEDGDGTLLGVAWVGRDRSHLVAAAPAALAARALAEDRIPGGGIVPPDRHVEVAALRDLLRDLGVEELHARIDRRGGPPGWIAAEPSDPCPSSR